MSGDVNKAACGVAWLVMEPTTLPRNIARHRSVYPAAPHRRGPAAAPSAATRCSNPFPREDFVFLQIMTTGDHTGAPGGPGTIYLVTVAGPTPVTDAELRSVRSPHIVYVDSWTRLEQLAPTIANPPLLACRCTDAQ
jgi:hypothetical protein